MWRTSLGLAGYENLEDIVIVARHIGANNRSMNDLECTKRDIYRDESAIAKYDWREYHWAECETSERPPTAVQATVSSNQ